MTRRTPGLQRWLPLLAALAAVVAILLHAGTPVLEIARYFAYAVGVVVPGTLVYRTLRGPVFTLVEDIAMGAAVGLVLELVAWAVLSVLDIRSFAWLWSPSARWPGRSTRTSASCRS